MTRLTLLLFFVLVATVSAFLPRNEYEAFKKFQKDFDIKYSDPEEHKQRFLNFKENLKEIDRLNAEHKTAEFGITQFSAMTYEEFGKVMLMDQPYRSKEGIAFQHSGTTPDAVDWRTQKVVSHIKNQGQCGSCWAFATTAALESQIAIHHKEYKLFSEQQLLDCVTDNYGCTGGYLDTAYRYMGWYGQVLEDQYEYVASKQDCAVPNAIMCPKEMMHYKSGIFDVPDCKATMLGWHALAIVGYTPDSWIIKNSWGAKWGEAGYIRFKRGVALCEMDSGAGGPIIKK
uniref:Cathepsin L n=1 Tax=Panagrolaimus sp. PS1159 TaxID=55785 RepID=A0AC35EU06_9BILA